MNQTPQNFFKFYYSGEPGLRKEDYPNFGVDLWVVGFSKDGKLAGFVSKDMMVYGQMVDLSDSNRPFVNENMECISNCKFTFVIQNGRKVQILEGGQVKEEEYL